MNNSSNSRLRVKLLSSLFFLFLSFFEIVLKAKSYFSRLSSPAARRSHRRCILGPVLGRHLHHRPGCLRLGAGGRDPSGQRGVSVQPGDALLQGTPHSWRGVLLWKAVRRQVSPSWIQPEWEECWHLLFPHCECKGQRSFKLNRWVFFLLLTWLEIEMFERKILTYKCQNSQFKLRETISLKDNPFKTFLIEVNGKVLARSVV